MATARDLLLTDAGDLYIGPQDLALVYDNEAIAQQARITLATFVGNVFFDLTAGTNWGGLLGRKANNINSLFAAEAKRALLSVPGIVDVASVSVLRNGARVGTIAAQCTADSGVLLTIQVTA